MDSKKIFSNRVDTYVKYRPSYPKEAVDYLYETVGLHANCEVADIGAGTGIFSKILLDRGSRVVAIEPNKEMREAAAEEFAGEHNYRVVPGSAEMTGLPDQSVDYIVCAQSFHWFDHNAAKYEFKRILKAGGMVALIWNSRLTQGTSFREGYDRLLHNFGTDYKEVSHKNISSEALKSFFKERQMQEARFTNRQVFDFEGLLGRLLSSSYSPLPGHPNYEHMITELSSLFERNKEDGKVFFDYETQVFWGEVSIC